LAGAVILGAAIKGGQPEKTFYDLDDIPGDPDPQDLYGPSVDCGFGKVGLSKYSATGTQDGSTFEVDEGWEGPPPGLPRLIVGF